MVGNGTNVDKGLEESSCFFEGAIVKWHGHNYGCAGRRRASKTHKKRLVAICLVFEFVEELNDLGELFRQEYQRA